MSRRKRKTARVPPVASPRKASEPLSAPPTGRVAAGRRIWIAAAVFAVVALVAGYFAATILTGPATAARKTPVVVEGDGVKGPRGMVWIPGGEFLMGSDHKLAQPNERPAHRVKVAGFWMDRHHV